MRLVREYNERAWLAWHIAALTRTQKMPQLSRIQTKVPIQKPWEEQLEDLKTWVVATGGKIITRAN
jgi:hypothetical protein